MKRIVWVTLLAITASVAPLQADVIVEIQDTSLNSGTIGSNSLGSIDVFARTDAGEINFGQFSLEFAISSPLSGTGILQFQSTGDQQSTERANVNYALAGQAASGTFQSNRQDPNLRSLIQQDQVVDAINFPLAGNTVTLGTASKLIATLEIVHESAAAVGGTFEVSLIESSSTFFQFYNGFTPTKVGINSQSFSNSGTVTVPEPSSLTGLLLVVGGRLLAWRRKRK